MVLTPSNIDHVSIKQQTSIPGMIQNKNTLLENRHTIKPRLQESEDLKVEILRLREQSGVVCLARDDVIQMVDRLHDKIRRLEIKARAGERAKKIIEKKNAENDILRRINRDLRGTITDLSKQMPSMKKTNDTPTNVSDQLIQEAQLYFRS